MSAFTGTTDHSRQPRPGIPDELVTLLNQAPYTGPRLVTEALVDQFDDITAPDLFADRGATTDAALPDSSPGSTLTEDTAFTVLATRRLSSRGSRDRRG
ncbi:hypothetical protein ABCR94_00210 [Streptomyces sp. 21So2-11]|uniref:hypothetical protein n=1 Tax=Streptomyces sp. 21So2-11 TaxID=3144408 RepID=UPI00321B2039